MGFNSGFKGLNTHKTKTILFSKHRPIPLPDPIQVHDTFVACASAIRYLGFVLDSKLLYARHVHTVVNNASSL
jgi:hypothetical protein